MPDYDKLRQKVDMREKASERASQRPESASEAERRRETDRKKAEFDLAQLRARKKSTDRSYEGKHRKGKK